MTTDKTDFPTLELRKDPKKHVCNEFYDLFVNDKMSFIGICVSDNGEISIATPRTQKYRRAIRNWRKEIFFADH